MPDEYLKSLYAALAAETDRARFEQLLSELDRYIDKQVKRARTVPVTETR